MRHSAFPGRVRRPRQALVVALCFFGAPFARAQTSVALPTEQSALFSGSGNCADCHTANGSALVDSSGTDLSFPTDWRSTLMANAVRDPFWQAKVESEVAEHLSLAEAIETKCTRCHAPLGNAQATFDGAESYLLDDARSDPLALDGVSCTLCHQVRPGSLGTEESFSGGYVVDDSREIFGPFGNVFAGPMRNATGFDPVLGLHVLRSELCATCHTLYTSYVDDEGHLGGKFPEQVPYLEWRNSAYPGRGTQCQSCHMPRVEEPVAISNRPPFVERRAPLGRHFFVGGNVLLLEILRAEGMALGATATVDHFSTTLVRTREQLLDRTARLDASAVLEGGMLRVSVGVENLAGHKFPTGFPSRRAWLHVRVSTSTGGTVFDSGAFDAEGRILPLRRGVRPHRDVISSEEDAQVYEAIMADVNGAPTFSLLRAASYAKDNRLPPRGFVTDAPGYGDMAIVGGAAEDANFNRAGPQEGTGTDRVVYEVDGVGVEAEIEVLVELLYQSVSPSFAEHLFGYETPAVRRFEGYYASVSREPQVVRRITLAVATGGVRFIRGDANADGVVDISDAVSILLYLFTGGDAPPCLRSADVQASGAVDVSDPVYLLNHLFLGGVAPVAPYPECGHRGDADALDCASHPPCEGQD